MNEANNQPTWVELHLRKARGEPLSEAERARYEFEMACQDAETLPLRSDLQALKAMRVQVAALSDSNAAMRDRIANLARQIRDTEQALNEQTRMALGVGI